MIVGKFFSPCSGKYLQQDIHTCSGKIKDKGMHQVTVYTNRGAYRINLTCTGKLWAFGMHALEFLPKF